MAGTFQVGSIIAKLRLDDVEFIKKAKTVVQAARKIGRDVKTALGARNTVEFIDDKPVLNKLNKIARGVRKFAKNNKLTLKDAFSIKTNPITIGFRRIRKEGVRAANAIKRAARGIGTPFRLLRRSIFSLQGALLGLGISIGGAALIERAKNVEGLTLAFENLSKSIGAVSGTFLGTLRKATKGAVSDLQLIQTTNNAVLLGVVRSQEEFAEFASLARQLGRAVGRDAVEAINDLTIGVGRQSRLILDNLGLIVKIEAATTAYAAELGVAVTALTDAERRTAFYNATIDAARKKVAALGPDTDILSDSIGRFRAQISNTATIIAQAFVRGGPFDAIANFLIENKRNILGFAQFVADITRSLIDRIGGLIGDIFGGGGLDSFTQRIAKFVTDAFKFLNTIVRVAVGAVFSKLGALTLALLGQLLLGIIVAIPAFVLALLVEVEAELLKGLLILASKIPGLSTLLGLDDTETLQAGLDAIDRTTKATLDDIEAAADFLQGKIDEMINETSDEFEIELVAAIEKAKDAIADFGDEGVESGNKVRAAFSGLAGDLQKAQARLTLTRADPLAGARDLTLQNELKQFQDRFNQLQKIRAQAIQDFPESVGKAQVEESGRILQELQKQIEETQEVFLKFVKAPLEAKDALESEFLTSAVATSQALEAEGPRFTNFGVRIALLAKSLEGQTPRVESLFAALREGARLLTEELDLGPALERATKPVFLGEQEFNKTLAAFRVRSTGLELEVKLEGVDEAVLDAKKLEIAIEPFRGRLSPEQTTAVDELIEKLRTLGQQKAAKTVLVEFTEAVDGLDAELASIEARVATIGLTGLDADFASLNATLQELKDQFPNEDFTKAEETFRKMSVAIAEAKIAETALEASELNRQLSEIGLSETDKRLAAIAREVEAFGAALRRAKLPQEDINRLLVQFKKESRGLAEVTVFEQFANSIAVVRDRVKDLARETEQGSPVLAAQEAFRESTREMTEETLRSAQVLVAQAEAAGLSGTALEALKEKVAGLTAELQKANDAGANEAGQQAREELIKKQGQEIGDSLERNVGRGLLNAFRRGESISKQWASIASGFFEDSMNKVIKSLADSIGNALGSVLENIGLGTGAGALVTGLLGVAGAIFGALENKSATTVEDFSDSINSSEAVRGVVAGPSNVAIAKVGDSLKEALRTTEILLERISIAVEGGGIGGGGGAGPGGQGSQRSNGALPLSTSTAT